MLLQGTEVRYMDPKGYAEYLKKTDARDQGRRQGPRTAEARIMLSRDGISGLVCLAISVLPAGADVLACRRPRSSRSGRRSIRASCCRCSDLLSAILIVIDFRAMRALHAPAVPPAARGRRPRRRTTGWCCRPSSMFGLYIFAAARGSASGSRPSCSCWRCKSRWSGRAAASIGCSRSPSPWRPVSVCHFVFEDYLSVLLPRGTWSGM